MLSINNQTVILNMLKPQNELDSKRLMVSELSETNITSNNKTSLE